MVISRVLKQIEVKKNKNKNTAKIMRSIECIIRIDLKSKTFTLCDVLEFLHLLAFLKCQFKNSLRFALRFRQAIFNLCIHSE